MMDDEEIARIIDAVRRESTSSKAAPDGTASEEYYFKDFPPHHKNGPTVVEVAKFNGHRRPEVVYTVTQSRATWTCDCPGSHRGNCKHVRMVQDWLHAGRPSPFAEWEKYSKLEE